MNEKINIDDLNTIKKRYKIETKDFCCHIINDVNYLRFTMNLEKKGFDKKIELLKQEMQTNKSISEEKRKSIINLTEIINEYYTVQKEAKDHYEFSDKLIRQIENNYKNNMQKNGIREIYLKLCKDIIESSVEKFIKCEKELILVFDKFNNINFL